MILSFMDAVDSTDEQLWLCSDLAASLLHNPNIAARTARRSHCARHVCSFSVVPNLCCASFETRQNLRLAGDDGFVTLIPFIASGCFIARDGSSILRHVISLA